MVRVYKKPLDALLAFTPRHGLILLLVFSVFRMILVFDAAKTGNYQWVSLVFITMIVMAAFLLTRAGRIAIGWKRIRVRQVILCLLTGLFCAVLTGITGWLIYDWDMPHWYAYISQSYQVTALQAGENRLIYFLIFASVGVTFSPFGEELFYRGIIHESFRALGEWKASLIDSAAFSLVHLAHFGIVWTGTGWNLLPVPALIWMSLLFGTCLVFGQCRRSSGSIWGAVAAHAGFNLGMNYLIFFHVL